MMQAEKSKQEMLQEINQYDFAIVEMTEYLDTHPMEKQAVDYVNYYIGKKNEMMEKYSRLYGPLTVCTADPAAQEWKWALEKMPWEGGCR